MPRIEVFSPSASQWLTTDQAADVLQVSERTIRRMCSTGEIDGRRIGGRSLRINAASLTPEHLGKPVAFGSDAK